MPSVKPRLAWFLAFTAVFAVLAGYVFWGTWSVDVNPIMPDCLTVHPVGYFAALSQYFAETCLKNWQFLPEDFLLIVGTPYFRQEFQYVLAAFFAALGMVYYCRGRGLSRLAAYSAGTLLAFSGYWFSLFSAGHLGWFRIMAYCVFAFGLSDRMVRKEKPAKAILLGAVLAWACRSQQDLWMIFTIFAAAYFIWCCVRERKIPSWRILALAALSFAVIGATNVRTAFTDALASREQQLSESKGSTLSGGESKDEKESKWVFVTNWSMPPEDTLEFFIPRIHGDTSCPLTLGIGARRKTGVTPYTGRLGRPLGASEGSYRQHSLYVGFITCALALAAILLALCNRRNAKIPQSPNQTIKQSPTDLWFFAISALGFWILSMGRFCEPVYRVVFSIPLLDSLRAPVKWHHATEFAIVALAAYGIDALTAYLNDHFQLAPRKVFAIIAAIVLVGAFDLARVNHLYCAPVDMREVKRQNADMQLTFLPRSQLASQQGAALMRSRRIIPIATYPGRDDIYLVEALSPRKPPVPPASPGALPILLGLISLAGTIAAGVYTIRKA